MIINVFISNSLIYSKTGTYLILQLTRQNTITVVTSTEHCEEIASLLSKENVLAVDCQGVHLGVYGTLTLLQIGTSRGDVYLFDVHTCKDLLSVIQLKNLFESLTIVKVGYLKIIWELWEQTLHSIHNSKKLRNLQIWNVCLRFYLKMSCYFDLLN